MNDLLWHVAVSAVACSAAIASILFLRKPMTRRFGACATYALWTLVPLTAAATWLPARSVVILTTLPMSPRAAAAIGPAGMLPMAPVDGGIDAASALCGLWAIGATLSVLLFVLQQHRFVRGLGRLDPVAGNVYRAQATRDCPALVGAWPPRIVLPLDFETRYSAVERALILAHERHHLARGDALINALAMLLRSVYWFDPLIHFATPRFLADQELACDAAVIARFPDARRAYANAMMKTQTGDFRAALACSWSPRSLLRERIARLAQPSIGSARRRLGGSIVAALIVAGSFAAWAARPTTTQTQYEIPSPIDVAAVGADYAPSRSAAIDSIALRLRSEQSPAAHRASVPRTPSVAASDAPRRLATVPRQTRPESSGRAETPLASQEAQGDAMEPAPSSGLPPEQPTMKNDDQPPRERASDRRDHAPTYPPAAARAHLEGRVVLDVGIDATGQPTDARVASLQPSTASELASASLAAVTHWRFEPARRDGRAVSSRVDVPFAFALSGESSHAASEPRRQASYRAMAPASDFDAPAAEGVVYVRVRIESDGTVSSSEIDRIDPPSATSLGPSALSVLKTWTFNPARERDKTIASTAVVPIVFGANAQTGDVVARVRNALDPIRVVPKRS